MGSWAARSQPLQSSARARGVGTADLSSWAHLGKGSKPGTSSFSSFLLLKQIFPRGYSQSSLRHGARLQHSSVSQEFPKPPSPVTSLGSVYSQTLRVFFKGHCFFRFVRGP